MQLNPYLSFDGQCEAAFKFYENCLRGKILMLMKYGESPLAAQTPSEWHQRVIHATLSWGEYILQAADAPPHRYQKPQGFSVMLNVDSAKEAERIFSALAIRGTVQIPLEESFWASRFGELVDQFGTPWTINCGKVA